MKRTLVLIVVLLVAGLAPLAGRADIPDGVQCAQSGLGTVPLQRASGGQSNLDRFAICVTDGNSGNGAELYFGGEQQPEHPVAGPCTAFILLGRTISGDAAWYRIDPGANPVSTNDDVLRDCQ